MQIAVYKKERDPEKPKKPPTAFFFFLTDFRAQMAGQKIETGRRLTEICGEQWNKLTEEQKSPYMNIYAAEVKKYQDAMEEYKSRVSDVDLKFIDLNIQTKWRMHRHHDRQMDSTTYRKKLQTKTYNSHNTSILRWQKKSRGLAERGQEEEQENEQH